MTDSNKSKKATSPLIKLREIYSTAKLDDGFLDPYSVKTVLINDILATKKYNAIVDWACVFNTIYDIFREQRGERKLEGNALENSDVEAMAKAAHAYLSSLPLAYHFLLPMPSKLELEKEKRITSNISIIKLNEKDEESYKVANPEPKPGKHGALATLLQTMQTMQTQVKIPEVDTVFLKVSCHGYVGDNKSTVFEQDPIYIYKVWFSLNFALGNLKRDTTPRNPAIDQFARFAFRAYTKDKKYASSLSRPDDEARLINRYSFDKVPQEDIDRATAIMSQLMTKANHAGTEKLRNQIVNSLFWYFETLKTENPNLKTVFFTSVFDSFFDQEDKSKDKSRMIAIEASSTTQQFEIAREELERLYQSRNEIIHGERALLDYQLEGKKKNEAQSALVEVSATNFYNRYLTAKLNRFGKSVGLFKS